MQYRTDPPTDHVAALRATLAPGKTKPSYGIDSPFGLVISFPFTPLYLYATTRGKYDFWDVALAALDDGTLAGPSLDAGCGRGLVLVKVAERKGRLRARTKRNARTGEAVVDPAAERGTTRHEVGEHAGGEVELAYGIDIFGTRDQTGNAPEATVRNVVAAQVDAVVHTGSFMDLPYADGSFTLVTSSLALHNPKSPTDRAQAVRELARVLRPGGTLIILDLYGPNQTRLYARVLEELGWTGVENRFAGMGTMYGLWASYVVRGVKPG